jgi:hypothetical protein
MLCAALVGCALAQTRGRDPLAERVTLETLESLATLAAADRACRQQPPSVSDREDFALCMRNQADVSACEVTAADLSQLQTLMREDPRLTEVASFPAVIEHMAIACDAGWRAQAAVAQPLQVPDRCEWNMATLLTAAVSLRIPRIQGDATALAWQACNGTRAQTFLREQCRRLAHPGSDAALRRERLRARYLDYFCPLPSRSD